MISPYYDSLIAKVVVSADDRDGAIARARRALRELEVSGVPTTRELELDILGSEPFTSGSYSTSYLDDAVLPSLAR